MSYTGHSLGGGLTLCRDAVGLFYSPNRLGKNSFVYTQLNRIKRFYLILFDINQWFEHSLNGFQYYYVTLIILFDIKKIVYPAVEWI